MNSARPIFIRDVRILDPAQGRDELGNLLIVGDRLASAPSQPPPDAEVVDGAGLAAAPGFTDLHVHVREPGDEEAETIASACRAAVRGGFTTIVAMPNTQPPVDSPERVADQLRRGHEAAWCRFLTTACITRGRTGEIVAPLEELAAAGAVAFTDDGSTTPSEAVMHEAMRRAAAIGRPILDHAQSPQWERDGVVHAGPYAARWGLPGIPAEAETVIVERDLRLAVETGCRVHLQHLSTAAAVELLQRARTRGVRVSAEVTPHHLVFTDADVRPDDTRWKVNPPLRTARDRLALNRAVQEGLIEVLASDHAPHTALAKQRPFLEAPFGMVGLEIAVPITYSHLVHSGRMTVLDWVRRWTVGPCRVLGLLPPTLTAGAAADLVLLDLQNEWTIRSDSFYSRSRNTPFDGWTVRGRVVRTYYRGVCVYAEAFGVVDNPPRA